MPEFKPQHQRGKSSASCWESFDFWQVYICFFFGRGLLVGCSDLDSLFSSVGFGRICCQVEGFGTPLSLFGCVGLVVQQIILLGS